MNFHAPLGSDMPTITSSAYGGATSFQYTADDQAEAANLIRQLNSTRAFNRAGVPDHYDSDTFAAQFTIPMTKRIVRVYLADTDENVPLDKSILHATQEKLTDLTDQELFFEMPVQDVLTKHNSLRVTLLDKKATARSGRDTFLEPVKIRDLKMTVISVASF